MKLSRLSLLIGLSLAASTYAFGETADTEADRLSADFREFVDVAIDEGLLTPVTEQPKHVFRGRLDPSEPEPTVEIEESCVSEGLLDLQQFQEVRTYEHFLAWRDHRNAAEGFVPPAETALGFMSIGLHAEARLQIAGMEDPDSDFLRELSVLLEDGRANSLEVFEHMSTCSEAAGIWFSLAKVTSLDPEGPELLGQNLMSFRRLPHYLKTRFAALAVPALDRMDQPLLAEKLMADFSAEEITWSRRLSLNSAILEMRKASAGSDAKLREYMQIAELRAEAAAALMRNGFPVDPGVRQEVVGTILKDVESLPEGGDVTTNLRSMFDRPADISDYETILRMSQLPALQDDNTRLYLSEQLVKRLKADFAGSDRLANVAAMSAALLNRSLLTNHPERDGVMNSAAKVSASLGLGNVTAILSQNIKGSEGLALHQAALAYRMYDHNALKSLSKTQPGNPQIMRLAAMSAIMTRDARWLEGFSSKLVLDDETIIDLIECDAAYGNWVLPESIYSAAAKVTHEDYQPRVAAVLALKARSASTQRKRLQLSQIPENLEQIELALNSTLGGAP